MSGRRLPLLILLLMITAAFSLQSLCPVWAGEMEAVSEISRAEDSLKSAYLSVLEAERTGGEVSGLVQDLNRALEDLSAGERSLRGHDYEMAVALAGRAADATRAVADDAKILKSTALYRGELEFRNRLVITAVVVYYIVLFGFAGWSLFKDYYRRRVMGLRPEVAVDET